MPLYARTILFTGPPEQVELASRKHEEHLLELREQGRLRAAGRFGNGDGYLEIYDAADLHEADRIARASPLVEEGLGSWMLREWIEL